MKKFSLLLTMAALLVSSSVFAGSIDYLSNQSAKYLMTFHRTASTDASADIANYNPAGTAFLAPGFYIDISNQTLFKPYEQKYDIDFSRIPLDDMANKFEQDTPTYLLPNVYMAYNFGEMGPGKLAAYAHVGISAGGGSLEWKDGTAGTNLTLISLFGGAVTSQKFEVYSVYFTGHIGAAYAFLNDMVSISLGGKVIMPKRSLKLDGTGINGNGATSVTGEYEYEATGYTPVVGLDIKPMPELTIAVRYEAETDLEFKYKQKTLNASGSNDPDGAGPMPTLPMLTLAGGLLTKVGIADGEKFNYNLPQILSLGIEYKVMPELAVMASTNIYFLGQADMGDVYNPSAATKTVTGKVSDYYGTGWEAGLGAKYTVMKELVVGAGFIYTESGAKDKYFEDGKTLLNCSGNPPLDSWTIGLGGTYTVIENLDLTLAGAWTHYIPKKYDFTQAATEGTVTVSGEYKKDVYNIGIGVGYKI